MADLHDAIQAEIDAYRPETVPGFAVLHQRKRARRRRVAVAAVAACALGALATAAVVRASGGSRDPGITREVPPEATVMLSCRVGPAFPSSALRGPGGAERGEGPAAQALRDYLAGPAAAREFTDLPRTGWHELVRTGDQALYGVPGLRYFLYFALVDGTWRMAGSQAPCRAVVVPPRGTGPASWFAETPVGPGDRSFTARIDELTCNGGQSAAGRIEPPAVEYTDTTVVVTFFVRKTSAGTCLRGTPAPYEVVLREPLGGRTLLDGYKYPPVLPIAPEDR